LRKFAPSRNAAGEVEPKMVFVNSLSDFWHEQVPAQFVYQALRELWLRAGIETRRLGGNHLR